MHSFCKLLVLLLLSFIWTIQTHGQNDAHYSANQFGLKGMLMSGALVAGDDEGSMTFYNPAALGYVRARAIDIALLVPNFQITQLTNGFGDQSKDGEFDFQMIPNFVSFKLSLIKNPKVGMGAAVLYKNNYENFLQYEATVDYGGDILNSDIQYRNRKREVWIGLGISYALTPNFNIGLSQFITFRRNIYSHQFSQTIVNQPGSTTILGLLDQQFNIDLKTHFGLVNRLGLSYKGNRIDIGLTLTTPTYGYPVRNSDYQYKSFIQAIEDDALIGKTYTQEKQKVVLKTPFSTAFGMTVKLKNFSTINFSTEYFGKIKSYDVINKIEAADTFRLKQAAKQVINVAMGWEIRLNENFYYLGGFRTDFNYSESVSGSTTQLYTSNFNIYHISNGLIVWLKNNKLTVGLDYGFSFDKVDQLADVTSFDANNIEIGNKNSRVTYQSFALLFTYGFLLNNFRKKAAE